ncbi:MAG TPA: hypothetical protein VHQ46_05705 [Desulfobacteria bacterium]|nr:hypothetical protein [Desulfobacteria bacterium]
MSEVGFTMHPAQLNYLHALFEFSPGAPELIEAEDRLLDWAHGFLQPYFKSKDAKVPPLSLFTGDLRKKTLSVCIRMDPNK